MLYSYPSAHCYQTLTGGRACYSTVQLSTHVLQVTASQATNATANQASKYIAADITADQTAFDHGHATVSSGTSGDKVAGSVQGAGTEHAEVAFTG